jgi:hypothetical protein
VLNELTHLPVILDPSHATGKRSLVPALAKAAVAIGADGMIVEVHPCPEKAVSDGAQSLTIQGFRDMMTRDLDAVLACFTPRAKYLVVEGRFDWSSLQSYAREQGGTCRDALCRMSGSTPERKISFFPLRPNLMGLAVGPDDSAAIDLESTASRRRRLEMPNAPVWISIPPALLKNGDSMPPGTRMFAHTLEDADDVSIAMAPSGDRFEARLTVQCRSERQATALAAQLGAITGMLREMIAREHQTPNPGDLSGVLTSGAFNQLGTRVLGSWPLEKGFVAGLLGGG